MNIPYDWLFRVSGGSLMITGWLLFHFFNVVFDESIKFVILGIALILFSFILNDYNPKPKKYSGEINH